MRVVCVLVILLLLLMCGVSLCLHVLCYYRLSFSYVGYVGLFSYVCLFLSVSFFEFYMRCLVCVFCDVCLFACVLL